ncbi:hypothetical protein QP938_13345 [Porticoccaceae bacterium LTM1]|nr:hypothetical protein QP938_13345 [Porticoccaceae bacterium LTM1]
MIRLLLLFALLLFASVHADSGTVVDNSTLFSNGSLILDQSDSANDNFDNDNPDFGVPDTVIFHAVPAAPVHTVYHSCTLLCSNSLQYAIRAPPAIQF